MTRVEEHEWYRLARGTGKQKAEWKGQVWSRYTRWYHRASADDRWDEVRRGPFAKPERTREIFIGEIQKKLAEGYQWVSKVRFAAGGDDASSEESEASKAWPKAKAKAPRWLAKVPAAERERVRGILEKAELAHRANDILTLARPAIRFALTTAKALAGVTTRFGGAPDLPADFTWPMNGKVPLAFVAQFRLDELAALDLERRLPREGVLSAFACLTGDDDGETGQLVYFEDADDLVRTTPPHAAKVDGRPSKTATATANIVLTLPALGEKAYDSLRLTEDEEERYDEQVLPAVRMARSTPSKPGAHQLLGWSDTVTPSSAEELLGQIDSDGRFGFEVGDVETLRVWINSKKRAAHDFARARFTVQAD